jgi:hypothetical protein
MSALRAREETFTNTLFVSVMDRGAHTLALLEAMAISVRVIALLIEALHCAVTIFLLQKLCVCFVLVCCKETALWVVRRRNEGISVVDANRFRVG